MSFQTSKFYQLLHTKYQKNKPELKLSIYIDDDKGAQEPGFKAKEAPARVGQGVVWFHFYIAGIKITINNDDILLDKVLYSSQRWQKICYFNVQQVA